MSPRLKVGIVGAGIGEYHIAAFRELPDLYSVEALCDLDEERARRVAAETGVPRTMAALDDLLALDLDIVDICTPSNLHFEQAMKALAADRHVLVEKPLAGSLAEVDALEEAERRTGRRVIPVFQYRFGHGFQRFLHLKAKGVLGKPYVATAETHWRRTADYYDNPWRGRAATELGGCLVTHAIHAHDILTQAMGPVASVYARTATRVNAIETEDCAILALEMASGALATASVTLGAEEEISRLRFCFDGLTVESSLDPYHPGGDTWRFVTGDEAIARRIADGLADFVPGREKWTGQFAGVHAALSGAAEMPVTLADARASVALFSAAYRSAQTGERVVLPIERDNPAYGNPPRIPRKRLP